MALPPLKADGLAFAIIGAGNNKQLVLSWNDNSINETAFLVQKSADGVAWTDVGVSQSPLDQLNVHGIRSFTDTTFNASVPTLYRVVAQNSVGYGLEYPTMTVQSVSDSLGVNAPAAPTNLAATVQAGSQVSLTFRDNATNEAGFSIERSTNGIDFVVIGTAPARNNTGNVTFIDNSVLPETTFIYRVAAFNLAGSSAYSNTAQVYVPGALPLAPSSLTATLQAGPQIGLAFIDNATNEAGFVLERSVNGGPFVLLVNLAARNNTGNVTSIDNGILPGTTYQYRVAAVNSAGQSAFAVSNTPHHP